MEELKCCPFCGGEAEIVTLSCSSGGTPCYCFRCTKCGGIRRFGTLNPADLCRECELTSKTRELERRFLCKKCSELAIEVVVLMEENGALKKAGNTLLNRITDVLDGIVDELALRDAVSNWQEAKGEAE